MNQFPKRDCLTASPLASPRTLPGPCFLTGSTAPKKGRPLHSATATVGYGETFTVSTLYAAQVAQVRWIRLGSVTHAFDMNQRANTLSFTADAGGVQVTAPSGPDLAPPGHYLLFILNRNGVPSVGKVVKVQ